MGDNIPQQQNQDQILSFRPTIWVDDDASNNNNANLEIGSPFEGINIDPESLLTNYQLPEDGSDTSGIEISDNYQPVFMKKKRGITSDDKNGNNDGSNDEEEILYLPVYSDPDAELVNRHKYSGLSKRSEPKVKEEEFKESYEYPVMVSLDGKEIPTVHYTMHDKEEPSGLTKDIDVYEPTLMEEKDTSGLYGAN